MEAAGGINEEDIDATSESGTAGIERDGGGVGVLFAGDDIDAEAFGPDGELMGGAGAEGVAGREEN